MNSLIVYHSGPLKNTEKIAIALAESLHAQLRAVAEVLPADCARADVIGLGAGIHFWRHHRAILECSERLALSGKKVFIFSTGGWGFGWLKHAALRRRLARKSARIIGEFTCAGRPDARGQQAARAFALKLEKSLVK
ncbi:MAG TPA: flavodoxin domain-containing protein [Candidatus Omnitrophota bacterium]|nr:flavodoxin domain-containing protein [Candidatus Omnitrophota bacterium]